MVPIFTVISASLDYKGFMFSLHLSESFSSNVLQWTTVFMHRRKGKYYIKIGHHTKVQVSALTLLQLSSLSQVPTTFLKARKLNEDYQLREKVRRGEERLRLSCCFNWSSLEKQKYSSLISEVVAVKMLCKLSKATVQVTRESGGKVGERD